MEKLPRCLERYTVAETLPNEFYKLEDDKNLELDVVEFGIGCRGELMWHLEFVFEIGLRRYWLGFGI